MRCCKSCGCYLPDGVSKCLACSYDETDVDIVPRSGIGIDRSGYELGQWSEDVRSPMRIIQVPYMPTKDNSGGYSWRAFDGKIWREYEGVVFPPPVTRKQ